MKEGHRTFLIPPVALLSPRTAGTRCSAPPLDPFDSDVASSSFSSALFSPSTFPFPLSGSGVPSTGFLFPPSPRRPDAFVPLPPRPLPRPRPLPLSLSPPRRGPAGACAGAGEAEAEGDSAGVSSGFVAASGTSCGGTSEDTCCSSAGTGMISSSKRSSLPRVCANSSSSAMVYIWRSSCEI